MYQQAGKRLRFDGVASLYDRARPPYPEGLVEAIARGARIGPASRVLEVGCGTGQMTMPLGRTGAAITALELGPRLAAIASARLAPFPRATVVVADFDRFSPPEASFDVVVAAAAFHWLDPRTRLARCAGALRPGGALVVVETRWGVGDGADRFFGASRECYARWDPHPDPAISPCDPRSLPATNHELETSGLFEDIRLEQMVVERRYRAEAYCDLLGSFSNVLAWPESARRPFIACIRRLIEKQFAGAVVRKDLYRAWLARRSRFGAMVPSRAAPR